jgi:glycosyltransferase involved in cell wall biosynthesis
MMPKVSVCIPTYNYGRYIGEAIESVLNQTYSDFELLIIDDASQDNTDAIVREYAIKDDRIRYLRNATNVGMVQNWNSCLHEARGEYIKYLFGDDAFASTMLLEKMVRILDSDRSVSLVGSSRKIIDKNSKQIDLWSFYDADTIVDGKEVISKCLFHNVNYIGEPTVVMFRRSQAIRGYNIKYKQIVDLEMWFHLLEQGTYCYIKEPLAYFRCHEKQQTKINEKCSATIDDMANLYLEYMNKPYIKFGWLMRKYLIYDYFYQIWKSYKKKKVITKTEAVERIDKSLGMVKFVSLYPFFKIVRPFFKHKRSRMQNN